MTYVFTGTLGSHIHMLQSTCITLNQVPNMINPARPIDKIPRLEEHSAQEFKARFNVEGNKDKLSVQFFSQELQLSSIRAVSYINTLPVREQG